MIYSTIKTGVQIKESLKIKGTDQMIQNDLYPPFFRDSLIGTPDLIFFVLDLSQNRGTDQTATQGYRSGNPGKTGAQIKLKEWQNPMKQNLS